MDTIDQTKPVMVTGGTGYLAAWIIKMLLDKGISVNATVRDPSNAEKVAHLKALASDSTGQLNLFKADLMDANSFKDAMQDCELVLHTASPFIVTHIKDPQAELIRPAIEGTRSVLQTAAKVSSIKRIVLTSSVVAMYGDCIDIEFSRNGPLTEAHWNETSNASHQPYPYSKTLAEKEAWALVKDQSQWDLVVINPAWILGPSLSPRTDSFSIRNMINFGDGTYRMGAPEIWSGVVDVRDVAAAHINAGFTPVANGRYIIASGEATLMDIAKILRKHFGNAYPWPLMQAPKFVFWMIAPLFGFTRKYASLNTGYRIKMDNSRSQSELGMTYRPFEQTIKEHFQQLIDDGVLPKH